MRWSGAAARKFGLSSQMAAGSEEIQHIEADGRRQIALLARAVDLADEFGQGRVAQRRNFFQATPECLFETDAGLVSGDDDGAFNDGGFNVSRPSVVEGCARACARA